MTGRNLAFFFILAVASNRVRESGQVQNISDELKLLLNNKDFHKSAMNQLNYPEMISEGENITVVEGYSHNFTCKVKHLRDHLLRVSWIREKDLQVLATGIATYVSDSRFHTWHSDDQTEWKLIIDNVKLTDTGRYQCQVGTEPKLSRTFHLEVTDLDMEIVGGEEMHVKPGTKLEIICLLKSSLLYNKNMFHQWFFDNKPLPNANASGKYMLYDRCCNRICLDKSTLLIYHIAFDDIGEYKCSSVTGKSTSVTVHVMEEFPAAVYQSRCSKPLMVAISNIALLLSHICVNKIIVIY